ncbi:hypothetical protein SAMN05444344_0706 [Tenacibaculum mesophilum]|uniref:hypothetical protein n=1 Tax=Tenacibaculum mesophilum TaxID=104268 RepID=UPI000920E829|nr:hypothetical protein [Tenacibaculum mesophilum]QFS28736.1 hypothetical protein F9Y86_10155 [Tenacibaculum mesophilum]SHF59702.1 hypothetical protein SAMN05444344_0706 [Tenacibaculum mesophilum]
MKTKTTPLLLHIFLLIIGLTSCKNTSKKSTETEINTIINTAEDNKDTINLLSKTEENKIPDHFTSRLRPNEQLKWGRIYTDTVVFVDFNNMDYDDVLFRVKNNDKTVVLISDDKWEGTFSNEQKIMINWRIDSIRPAGDPEYLEFREFLVSATNVNNPTNENHSFVISCGSGCAITYTQNKIVSNNNTHEVTFKVKMYVNELLSEEYYESYFFTCTPSNGDAGIKLKEDNEVNSDNVNPEVLKQLKLYIPKLCKN